MKKIDGDSKSVRDLLKGRKYSIDYYQRDYKWEDKQIRELIDDLSNKFLEDYDPGHHRKKVADYPHYFLGSIIISAKENGENFVVDGQQRLTSLTLLLVYLRNLQQDRPPEQQVNIDELIVSEAYGAKSFNIDVEERAACMAALFEAGAFEPTKPSESVQNILDRYEDIEDCFPAELRDDALPFFIDWLQMNVFLVEITAYSDDEAYTIFETMNDRGLSLSPTDMLKGYLLANITDPDRRNAAGKRWKDRLYELHEGGKEVDADFFKAWLRSQYANKIRERKAGAKPEDFDRIGTEFHRWLRDASPVLALKKSDDFYGFVERDFTFFSRHYLTAVRASRELTPGLEAIRYNADQKFTLQFMLLLAPLTPDDSDEVVRRKFHLVSTYVDILLARRIWNFHSTVYSTMQYAMFLVMREIRGLSTNKLAKKLHAELEKQEERISDGDRFRLNQWSAKYIHRILARLTDYVETQSGNESRYAEYVAAKGKNRYEVEHIWANKFDRHKSEFSHPTDFAEFRNRIGGLLLLPKSFNASYGDLTYEKKLKHYNAQNLLARTLNEDCYDHNPGFKHFVGESKLPFKPYEHFSKADLDQRGALYRQIAERIWDPKQLLEDS